MTVYMQQQGNPPPPPESDRTDGTIQSVKFSLKGEKAKITIFFEDPLPDGTLLTFWLDADRATDFVTAMGDDMKVDVEPPGSGTPETYTFHK